MPIWDKTTIGDKYKIVLPKKLRSSLKLVKGDQILWVDCIKKKGNKNEYTLDVIIVPKE